MPPPGYAPVDCLSVLFFPSADSSSKVWFYKIKNIKFAVFKCCFQNFLVLSIPDYLEVATAVVVSRGVGLVANPTS